MITFATSGLDLLVQILRYRISDQKCVYTTVVQEDIGTASGIADEIFYSLNMPITSGSDTHLRCGRWYYTKKDTAGSCAGLRAYTFNVESGAFVIPNGAIYAETGSRVTIGYTWEEEQEYKFRDKELQLYIGDAINAVNNDYDFGFRFSINGDTYSVSPTPTYNDFASHIYPQYASILIKRQLESEGFGDRIYLRDLNITIDTSKGIGDLSKSLKDLDSQYQNTIKDLMFKGQEAAFCRIDTYSTKSIDGDYQYTANYNPIKEYGES